VLTADPARHRSGKQPLELAPGVVATRQQLAERSAVGQLRPVAHQHLVMIEFVEAALHMPFASVAAKHLQAMFRRLPMAGGGAEHHLAQRLAGVTHPAAEKARLFFAQRR
jgi:hypothetical protein